jgi:hypothetical protein
MKTQIKNLFVITTFSLLLLFQMKVVAQQNSFSLNDNVSNDNVVMTWNKNTPETEMKDDIKALSDKGITIKYSNLKRNSQNEITAIKVEYSDRKGNKGNLEYNNQKPISQIVFFKQDDAIGFGQASNANNMFVNNPFMNGFANADDIMKQFRFQSDDPNGQSFQFNFPEDGKSFGKSKSRIQIQKDGKKPLVIEDGVVIEGGDDYTPEEIEKIKGENKIQQFNFNDDDSKNQFDFRSQEDLDQFKEQMDKMKEEMKSFSPDKKSELDQSKDEMLKAKEEMNKAREELEKAKKELEDTRAKLKSQKI